MRAKTSLGLMAILLFAVSAGQAKAEPVALNSSGTSALQLLEHVGYAMGGTTSGTGSVTSGTSSLSSETNAGTSSLPSGADGTSESGTVSLPPETLPLTGISLPDFPGTIVTGGTSTQDQDNSTIGSGGVIWIGGGGTGGVTLNSDAATPEPSTLGLVACLAGVGVVVWRAKRQKAKAGR